jgi:hypothetical protein
MTQNEKDLLIKDLCARSPYGVKVQVDLQSDTYSPIVCKVCSVECAEIGSAFIGVETSPDTYNEFREFLCKPYLFPLSSMTDGQIYQSPFGYATMDAIRQDDIWSTITIGCKEYYDIVDWLNKNHFDYRSLIEKGLALDATGLNIY